MKSLTKYVGWTALVLALIYVGLELSKHFENLPTVELTVYSAGAICLAILTYSTAMFSWGIGWGVLLIGLGESSSLLKAFSIIGVSQITKYVPGNVVHHIGRVALAKRDGLSATRVLSSMLLELAWMLAAAVSCAALALALGGREVLLEQSYLGGMAAVTFSVSALFAPGLLILILHFQRPRFFFDRFPENYLVSPGMTVFALNYGTQIVSFLLHGAAISVLAIGVLNLESGNYWLSVGVFSFSWLVGFVAPGAPAGLGVRDAVMIAGLSLAYSTGDAIMLAAIHRIVSVVGDVVVFVSALLVRRISCVERGQA